MKTSDAPTERELLQACPCCGGAAIFRAIPADEGVANGGGEFVECTKCGLCTNLMFPLMDDVKGQLAEKWNTRHLAERPGEAVGWEVVFADKRFNTKRFDTEAAAYECARGYTTVEWQVRQLPATPAEPARGTVEVPVKALLAMRDALLAKNINGAYHQLYFAVPWKDPFEPWAEWEAMLTARNVKDT